MKPQENRTPSWLVLSAMGGLVVAYAYYFYLPANRKIDGLRNELAAAERQAEQGVPLVAAIDATQKQLDAALQYTQAWEHAAPSENELAGVFAQIHNLTRLAETETTRFEPQPAVAYETFLRVPVSMEFRGNFAQLAAVLTGLERLQQPIWVRNVDIESN